MLILLSMLCVGVLLLSHFYARAGRGRAALALHARMQQVERRRHNRLSSVVHGAQDAWWEFDLINQTAFSSDRWRGMAGVEPGQAPCGVSRRAIHPEDREPLQRKLTADVGDPACTCYETSFRQIRRDGIAVPVVASATIERDAHGTALRIYGTTVSTLDAGLWHKVSEAARRHRAAQEIAATAPVRARPASDKHRQRYAHDE